MNQKIPKKKSLKISILLYLTPISSIITQRLLPHSLFLSKFNYPKCRERERGSLTTAIKKRLPSLDKSEKAFDILWKGVRIDEQSGSRLDNRLPRFGSWSPMEEKKRNDPLSTLAR